MAETQSDSTNLSSGDAAAAAAPAVGAVATGWYQIVKLLNFCGCKVQTRYVFSISSAALLLCHDGYVEGIPIQLPSDIKTNKCSATT